MLSLTSDYVTGTGDPSPSLRLRAEAGFTHVHWCHQWRSDFLYADSEIEQIGRWLGEYGLKLNDVNASGQWPMIILEYLTSIVPIGELLQYYGIG